MGRVQAFGAMGSRFSSGGTFQMPTAAGVQAPPAAAPAPQVCTVLNVYWQHDYICSPPPQLPHIAGKRIP